MRRFVAIFLSIWIATCNLAHAAPSVTSVSANGALLPGVQLTVTGTGFTTKTVAAPLKFDNFEGGTVGNDVGNGWSLSNGGAGATVNAKYTNTPVRTNSTRSVKHSFADNGISCSPDDGCQYSCNIGLTGLPSPPEFYFDFWYYYAPDPAVQSSNVKVIRLQSDTALNTPNLYLNIYCSANSDELRVTSDDVTFSGSGRVARTFDDCSGNDPGGGDCDGNPPHRSVNYWQNNWVHVQLHLKMSSNDTGNGTVQLWLAKVGDTATLEPNSSDWEMRDAADGITSWDRFWIGNFMKHATDGPCASSHGANHFSYTDDVYADTTMAHVEIGDNATYANCTEREIQVPSAWSTTSITIPSANRGAFGTLENKYLFVVDRDGNVSPGVQLTSGAAPGTCTSPF